MERKPVWIVWPPLLPILSSRSAEGSLPLLVRKGPLAWILTGWSSEPVPFSCRVASTFRFALWMSERNALSRRFSTSPLSLGFAAGDQGQRREERNQDAEAHAAQGTRPYRNSPPVPTLEKGCGFHIA